MKKIIISTLLALASGFIAGVYFKTYQTKKENQVKEKGIEKKEKTKGNITTANTHYTKENNREDSDFYSYEDFGPV